MTSVSPMRQILDEVEFVVQVTLIIFLIALLLMAFAFCVGALVAIGVMGFEWLLNVRIIGPFR